MLTSTRTPTSTTRSCKLLVAVASAFYPSTLDGASLTFCLLHMPRTTAFVGLNAFAVMVSAVEVAYEKRNRLVFVGILLGIAGTLLRTVIAVSADDVVNATSDEQLKATAVASVAALLQWANTVLLLLFIVFYTRVKLGSFEQLGMAIVYTPPTRTTMHCRAPVSVLTYADVPKSEDNNGNDDEAVVVCVTARLAKEYAE